MAEKTPNHVEELWKILGTPIEELGFPRKLENVLKILIWYPDGQGPDYYLGDIVNCIPDKKYVLKFPYLGKKSLLKIEEIYLKHGLFFGMDACGWSKPPRV